MVKFGRLNLRRSRKKYGILKILLKNTYLNSERDVTKKYIKIN